MKKLALVIMLAVAASWLLDDRRPSLPEKLASITGHGHHRSFDSHDDGDAPRTRVVVFREDAPRPPAPPSPPSFPEGMSVFAAPEPPSPPEPPRPAPWRKKADRARSGRASTASTSPAPMPSWFPKTEAEEAARARPDASGTRVLIGRVSASEERARQDLRKALEREVADWIAADVPTSWKTPAPLLDAMVRGTYVQKVARSLKPKAVEPPAATEPGAEASPAEELAGLDDIYTLYRAGQRLDFSPERKARIVEDYRRDTALRRMQGLGGGLVLALGLLAVMTGYIRADEATRGYYTNRLRLAALVGLGAAGAAAYRILS